METRRKPTSRTRRGDFVVHDRAVGRQRDRQADDAVASSASSQMSGRMSGSPPEKTRIGLPVSGRADEGLGFSVVRSSLLSSQDFEPPAVDAREIAAGGLSQKNQPQRRGGGEGC